MAKEVKKSDLRIVHRTLINRVKAISPDYISELDHDIKEIEYLLKDYKNACKIYLKNH